MHAEGLQRKADRKRPVRGLRSRPNSRDFPDTGIQLHHPAGPGRTIRQLQQGDQGMGRHDQRAAGQEGRPRHRRSDHHLRQSAGCGLHDAIHESGHQHSVQEAVQTGPEPVLVPVAAFARRLDLHGDGLSGSLGALVHSSKVGNDMHDNV